MLFVYHMFPDKRGEYPDGRAIAKRTFDALGAAAIVFSGEGAVVSSGISDEISAETSQQVSKATKKPTKRKAAKSK